ncbi:MAG: alpha/beta hydrolase family protein, partial [Actinomycetes bacterium]
VPGAGRASRDTMLAMARTLAASGIAAISYQKRTQGYSPVARDFGRLAADAVAAADLLAATPGIDPSRIGALGFSEGGWVAPLALQQAPSRFAFLALASAPVVSPLQQAAWMVDRPLQGALTPVRRLAATAVGLGRPVLHDVGTDISPALRTLAVPVYAVWGADDSTVPVNAAVRKLRQTVPGPVMVEIVPGGDHQLPADHVWLQAVGHWMVEGGSRARPVAGAEPFSALGLATLPKQVWVGHPVLHLLVSLAAALAVGLRTRRSGGRPYPRPIPGGVRKFSWLRLRGFLR